MSRVVKEMIESDIRERYGKMDSALVINVLPLTGVQANMFRGELLKKGIEVHVVKNSAARRALTGTALAPLAEKLTGPCAFVTGPSMVEAAKEIIHLAKDYPTVEMKFGLTDGETDVLTIEDMAKRRSLKELQGEVVMIFMSPARRIAGQLKVGSKVAGCVKAVADKLEKGETITKVA
ncbi:MAG: 50S ribosomal protein L10 [Planctomycetes bacterium]|nr:50S ribosomal protein L10 [Planctomycetota bacterium]